MTIDEAKDRICMMVSVAEDVMERQEFEECDNAGVMAIDALDKQIPVKPHKYTAFDGIGRNGCPRCFEERGRNEILYAGQRYCSVCGQKIERESR